MRNSLFFLVFGLLSSLPAIASYETAQFDNCRMFGLLCGPSIDKEKWTYIGYNNGSIVFLEKTPVKVDMKTGLVDVWTKSTIPDTGAHINSKTRYNCADDQYLILENHEFNTDTTYKSGGKLIDTQWSSVIPDTIGVHITKAVCTTGATQEIDKIYLIDEGYTSLEEYELVRKTFGKYLDAVLETKIQDSIDAMEW